MDEKRCTRCGQVKPIEQFHLLKKGRPWRASNCRPCDRERVAAYRKASPDRAQATMQRFRERHPLRAKLLNMEKSARYQWRKAGLPVEEVSYQAVIDRDGWVCYLCGGQVIECELSIDHVIPKSEGGPHSMANVRVTHIRCNDSKGAKLAAEARWRGRGSGTRGCYQPTCAIHGAT